MKTKTAISKITSLLLAFALVLGFAPTLQVSAAGNVTIDLGTVTETNPGYHYDPATGIITVRAAHAGSSNTVTISGDGTNGSIGYSIVIEEAQNITIADGTKIKGAVFYASLSVPAGATISGGGSGITITGVTGIFSNGALTLSGTMGNITGTGYQETAISTKASLTINGTVGDITATSGMGISSSGAVNISGTVGDITGNGARGIESSGAVNINGTVGDITGIADYGIRSSGAVNISGKTGKITGDIIDISASSYSVLDYTTTGNLDPANCVPAGGHTVEFNYGVVTMTGVDAPVKAYASNNNTIPAPTVPVVNGQTVLGWYTDTALTTPWDFATDTVDGTVTALYAKCSIVQPTVPQSFTATAGDAKVDLAWAAPASNGGSPITKYQYSASTGADNWLDIPSSDATTTSYLVIGLTNGTTYTFKVRAVNAIGNSPEAAATATPTGAPVAPVAPTITTTTLPNGTVNVPYSQMIMATSTMPLTGSIASGNLPAGLTLNASTGVVSGTPTTAGTSNFVVKVTNGTAPDATKALTIVVDPVGTPPPATQHTITLGASGDGTVTGNGTYAENSNITVTATPNTGWRFAQWTENGVVVSTEANYVFAVTAARTLTAEFEEGSAPNPVYPSGSGSGSSSGGSNKADTPPVVGGTATGTATSKPLTKAEATKQFEAALAAKPAGATALSIKINNATSVSKEVLAELAALAKKNGVTLTVHFDTVVGGKVTSRLSVNPATATGDLNVAITENKALAARFAKYYSNQLAAYTIPAAGSVAIKLPENLKPEDLVLYSYDPATNTYSQLQNAKLWVDSNGYVHFDVAAGTEVVISQGKLVKK